MTAVSHRWVDQLRGGKLPRSQHYWSAFDKWWQSEKNEALWSVLLHAVIYKHGTWLLPSPHCSLRNPQRHGSVCMGSCISTLRTTYQTGLAGADSPTIVLRKQVQPLLGELSRIGLGGIPAAPACLNQVVIMCELSYGQSGKSWARQKAWRKRVTATSLSQLLASS